MNHQHTKGFSIIELIVALSIFVTLTAVLLANYNSINKRLSLDTLVHQMAQWVRETQISAMSVKSHSGSFRQGFGLHFEQASSTQFTYFADLPDPNVGNKQYDYVTTPTCGDATVECSKVVTLQQGNKISMICGSLPVTATPVNQGICPIVDAYGNTTKYEQLDNVDIVFTRPNPDSEINGAVLGTPTAFGNVVIFVKSVTGYERSASIWTTGQVTVQ